VLAGIVANRPHHANLWTGPDGIGKYLWCRQLARVALCVNDITALAQPCTCLSCTTETHPDLLVLGPEPAGLKIEPVRDLMAKCAMKPMLSRRRVVIVRDAHVMTVQAQNAFLKTLEEPPGQTIFFLLSHQERRLLRTIRSRCQNVRFAPLDDASLIEAGREALATVPPETAPGLIAAAAGSVAQLQRLIAAAAEETLSKPLGPLLRAPLRERLAAVEALAEPHESTTIAAIRLSQQLAHWARTGNDDQRSKALQLFADLQVLLARADGNGNRKLLWERWLIQ